MLSPAQRSRLQQAEARQRAEVRRRISEFVKQSWLGLGSWRDADIDRFVEQVTPRVLAGQLVIARLTDAYLAQVLGVDPAGVVPLAAVRGVDPMEVYRRPAVTMRTKLAEGQSLNAALSAGATRAVSLATTDLQLAHTHQARASMTNAPSGFKRVPSGSENCALCLIASTQRYHGNVLLPIHPGCDCGVEPLEPGEPTGQVINEDLLNETHDWVGEKTGTADAGGRDVGLGTGRDYTKLIATREHGEYKATLTWARQHFDGPSVVH